MKELDQFRSSIETNFNFNYKIVQNNQVTTVLDFNVDRIQHLINKEIVDHIYNDKDHNSVKIVEKVDKVDVKDGWNFLKKSAIKSIMPKNKKILKRAKSVSIGSGGLQKIFEFTLKEILETSEAVGVKSSKDCVGINR